MIKTIFFDLNKVLVTYENINLNDEYLELIGYSQKEFWSAGKDYFIDYVIGKIHLKEFLMKIFEKLNIDINLLDEIIRLHEKNFSLVEGIYEIVEKLEGKYDLILLAGDGEESLNFKLDNFNLRHFFKKIYATCFEGILKGEEDFYLRVLRKENLVPLECLFIDDMDSHIFTATKLGINTIQFENSFQLEKELIKNNLIRP
ncbi:MAG: HAD family hydrolase [Minisyncoccales bacterium]